MADETATAETTATATTETAAADAAQTTTTTTTEAPAEKAAVVVPEKYDLKAPEGSTLTPDALERTAAIARELGLPDTAAAQKVVDLVHAEASAQISKLVADHAPQGEAWKKTVADWNAKALAHPEIGGGSPETYAANVAKAKGIITKYGDETIVKLFNEDPMGSHPDVVRFLIRLGKAAGEQPLVHGGPGGGTVPVAQRIYPNMNP